MFNGFFIGLNNENLIFQSPIFDIATDERH